jgi:stage V sporulation protein G
MEVTEVRVFPVEEERLKAYVAMPSKKRKDGTYRDTAHPLNSQTRQMIESIVLAEYNKEIQKSR